VTFLLLKRFFQRLLYGGEGWMKVNYKHPIIVSYFKERRTIANEAIILTITANLIIQVIVLLMLSYGYFLKRKQKFRQHGLVMASALIIHLIMIFYVMIPSFVYAVVPHYILVRPQELASIVGLIHGILGSITAVLGVGLVALWRFQKNVEGCFKRKKFMIPTIAAWISSLLLGILLYAIFIGPLIAG
jgi:uncharacterized membrane protein YozB (DUF420 family)